MHFYYEDICCFVAVCYVLKVLDINFETSWRYNVQGRVEFIIVVQLED